VGGRGGGGGGKSVGLRGLEPVAPPPLRGEGLGLPVADSHFDTLEEGVKEGELEGEVVGE